MEVRARALRVFVLAAVIAALPRAGLAAGFSIFEGGAKALGMGGAFAAHANDPSAIFFNSAGLADLEGTQVYAGVSVIFTGTEFAGVDPDPGFGVKEETGTLVFPPINVYVTHQLREGLGVGLGVYNAFGLGQDWKDPDQFTGRHIANKVNLKTFYFVPTIAWRPHARVALGVGAQMIYSSVELHRYIQQWDPNGSGYLDVGTLNLEGSDGLNFGFNAGLLVQAHEDFSLGASFRSQATAEIEGQADFTQLSTGDAAFDQVVAAGFPESQTASTWVDLPWVLSLAGAYTGVERWTFEADVILFGWSRFEKLPFRFANDPSLNVDRVQDYENTINVRVGLEYALAERWDLRVGYYWDETPQPRKAMSPILADSDRHGFTAGAGLHTGAWTADVFGLVLLTEERSSQGESLDGYNGTYASYGTLVGLNVGYRF
jgi:long-chain fatty acid transport protein